MLNRVIALSRYLMIVAVVGVLLAATALLIYGAITTVDLIRDTIVAGKVSVKDAKSLAITAVTLVDVYLLSAALLIIALGLYELFIDDNLPLPNWLSVNDLDGLKYKLASVIIIVLAVLFLEQVVAWNGEWTLLALAGSITLVIGVLIVYMRSKGPPKDAGDA
jgi:uncharacterized membrane protein YqhA